MITQTVNKLFGRYGAACALILSGLLLAGCQSSRQSQEGFAPLEGFGGTPGTGASTAAASAAEKDADKAVFSIGEPVTVTFLDLPQQMPPFEERIKEDGTIRLLHNQTFVAAGKTRVELEREIRDAYVPKLYVNMTVIVKPQENTRFYYVGGEVKLPGRQVYVSRLTVLRAIQSAGDFSDFAKKSKVQLSRVDGRKYTVDANKALKDPRLDLEVYPGDRINVPRKIW